MKFIQDLAARRRFGMRLGLDAIRALCAALGDPQKKFRAVHVAGTNGKGAVCAMLDAALRECQGRVVGRYTSPHLVKLNERFFVDGRPVGDDALERAADAVAQVVGCAQEPTFFEALTAVAFRLFADEGVERAVLECGLGGRLDATNVCEPEVCVITRIGLDHCDWLGDTVEKIAAEKAGIIKPGVPVVLGRNEASVRAVVEARAGEADARFVYAPDIASDDEIPPGFPLAGSFNRENAVTAIAALKTIGCFKPSASFLSSVVWPGRFQRVGDFIIDGAHNPPAAAALAEVLDAEFPKRQLPFVAGFCGDKDVDSVLRTLAPHVAHGFAVRTNNPRSLSADETAARMRDAGMLAEPCASLSDALSRSRTLGRQPTLVCGSLFLAGEALVALGAYPWGDTTRFDPSESLR